MKIRDNIYSVRAVDGGCRSFHGYRIPIGTTYNSYLVVDDQVTLIDFVKAPFAEGLLADIRAVIGSRPVDCVICNHAEPDHSGALPAVTAAYPGAVVYGTATCQKELKIYYPDSSYPFVPVKTGDTLQTGKYTFQFYPLPMVHWPDSMATYLPREKILFSNDAFGQHIGSGEMFDTDIPFDSLMERAGDYYANILLLYGGQIEKALKTLGGLEMETACPSHGVVLRDCFPRILAKYADWCVNKTDENRAVIAYQTMYGTTGKLARLLRDEYAQKGVEAELVNLAECHYSLAVSRLLEAKYVFVGSPTLNNQVMPDVAAFLTHLRGLKPKNRVGLAFGSYGWSGESVGAIHDTLAACGFEMLEPVKAMWNI